MDKKFTPNEKNSRFTGASHFLLAAVWFIVSSGGQAGTIHWTNPSGGFYEGLSNWTPQQVPNSKQDSIVLGMSSEYRIGLLSDKTIGGMSIGNNGTLAIGPAGGNPTDKTLTINGPASITDATLNLKRASTADMHLAIDDSFTIDGSLNVEDSATVTSGVGQIGLEPNKSGSVLVSGSSPDGEFSRWRATNLTIGVAGEGSLMIDRGGFVLSGETTVAEASNSVGHVTVRGSDGQGNRSQWRTGVIGIGSRGNGELKVENGGYVSSLNGYIGSIGTGVVTVGGVSDEGPSTWDVVRLLRMGSIGNGTMNIENGGQVTSMTSAISSGNVGVTGMDENGSPSHWATNSGLSIGTSGLAQVSIDNGAAMSSNSAAIGFGTNGTGEVRVRNFFSDSISTWTNTTNVSVGGSSTAASGTGTIDIQRNGRVEVGETMKIWSAGTVNLNRGELIADTVDVADGGTLNLTAGQLRVKNVLGDLSNQGATVQIDNINGNLTNAAGTTSPGPAAGATTITGSFTQLSDGTLALDIGGRSPGVSHDLVGVSGAAVLGGNLQLSLLEDFTPAAADQFSLLGADSIVGLFENVATGNRITTTDGKGSFVVHYGLGSAMQENRLIAYNFLATGDLLGDFDRNGVLDATDIDLLSLAVGQDDLGFDLVYDAAVNEADRAFWVAGLKGTYFGDSNLDGEFNTNDFIQVFQTGEYEDGISANSGWADGDWNGDQEFDSSDFILAFQSGGYEQGPRVSAATVPEPSSLAIALIAMIGVFSSLHGRNR